MTQPDDDDNGEPPSAALRVLDRLRDLAAELDPLERSVLAALIGPGISELVRSEAVDGLMDWAPDTLPDALVEVARRQPRSIAADRPF
ncbi:MAG: hypothetical protein U5K30_16055 [Acidimicrobiales bacterium]|nr:hypothetical protein [Acidimicrobiales bacterium]